MASTLTLTEDGFIDLTIGEKTKRIDSWEIYNGLLEARQEVSDAELPIREFHAKVVTLLEKAGFPGCSHKTANDVATALQEMVEGQKKSNRPSTTQSSAKSTDVDSSDSQAG